MTRLYLDTETYSELDLRKVGPARYMRDPSFDVMIVTWAVDDEPVEYADLTSGAGLMAFSNRFLPLFNSADEIIATNAPFDMEALRLNRCIERPFDVWRCLTVRAYRAGLPSGALEYVCKFVGIEGKLAAGKNLMAKFCKPRAPTTNMPWKRATRHTDPNDWARFLAYGVQDTACMREAYALLPDINDTPMEEAVRCWDWAVNSTGVRVDRHAITTACQIIRDEKALLNARIRHMTQGRVSGTDALAQLKLELAKRDAPLVLQDELTADTVAWGMADPSVTADVKALIETRYEASRATNGKWLALDARSTDDDLLRWHLQYYGASRTGRWSGRGVQLHNLIRPPRGVDARVVAGALHTGITRQEWKHVAPSRPVLEWLAYGIRGALVPDDGCVFVRGDLSQIEARKVNWLAGNQRMLDVFADPEQDPYVFQASEVGSDNRQLGKVLTLACGFGMAGETFRGSALTYGVELTSDQADYYVKAWREQNQPVVKYWYKLNDAFIHVIDNPGTTRVVGDCTFGAFAIGANVWAYIRLPSGRYLLYPRAETRETWTPSGQLRRQARYLSRKGFMWTHGSMLAENITQAASRDVLAWAGLQVTARGVPVRLHVHDELVAQVKRSLADVACEIMHDCLTQLSPWLQARPLSLAADVAVLERYAKV